MVPLYIHIVVKGFWQHAYWDPTLVIIIHVYYQIMLKSQHPTDMNSNATQTE